MSLKEYKKKRDFKETSEPKGKKESSEKKLIFVVQRHAASRLHYDFRLEMDGVLKSWAVPKGPSLNPEDKRLAMKVEDHPYSYRTFEGSIPKGNYGAGEVEIWDSGTYEAMQKVEGKEDDLVLRSELHKGSLKFILHGKKLKGEFALVKIKNSKDENAWLLIKHKDQFAKTNYDAEEHIAKNSNVSKFLEEKNSIKKKVETVKKFKNYTPSLSNEKKLKDFIKPMLAKTAEDAFDRKDWLFEIKWDGYRAIADLSKDIPLLYSRNGLSFKEKFFKISEALEIQKHKMILDGEIVAFNSKGKPDFQNLQQFGDNPNMALTYQVFDLLWLNGHSTENLTLLERKELLKKALEENEVIKYCDHVSEKGKEFFKQIKEMHLEGMMAKKSDSKYVENSRSDSWLKIKFQQTEDVIICGFTEPRGSRKAFGALILGKYLDEKLIYCGHTGTGFNNEKLKDLEKIFKPLITKKCPFEEVPKTNSPATWLKPNLICEIKFTGITKDGIFRHPVFLGLREDKDLEDLKNEKNSEKFDKKKSNKLKNEVSKASKKIEILNLKLTNQDKIYFPENGYTKGDVIEYYQSVAKYILPHLKNRPQSLNRFPNGIKGLSFYQKDAGNDAPDWIEKVEIHSDSNDKEINYLICNSKESLAYLNNLGCIDFNPWNSTIEHLENPTWMAIDLDPSNKNTFDQVIETALVVKEVLDLVNIKGFCKTSGSSGIHIFVPMNNQYSFEQVKNFAHILMQKVEKKLPKITTLERALKTRSDKKIYLDYLQNRSGQTLASVYSIRPKEFAPVSMPLEWEELKMGLKPTDFNIENALERIKKNGDLFKPVLGKGINMLKALENLSNA
ncbi:DNA ligase D [Halpernia sp.]|uniref:DNA ligase D n=1 Tax=Halpernia sp. TaxID=2782209 RepID=UPI003A9459B0